MITENTNIPTALIFFARPDLLEVTFEAVRKAQPNKLFLIQDGARINNENDTLNIEKCRAIVEQIDWECEVYRNYSDDNLGCGMRVYSGIKWAFDYTDRLLILEDDCVPAPSLFPFTAELLEKYQSDDRIGLICGMNNLGAYEDCPDDYFYTTSGSIWGWATWKRVWETFDYDMGFMEYKYATDIVFETDSKLKPMSEVLSKSLLKGKKLSSWSFQLGMNILLHSQLNIVPKFNMISNIGLDVNSANSVSNLKYIPRGLRGVYNMKTYDYKFPLNHPKYLVNDLNFKRKLDRLMGDGYPLVQLYRQAESVFYRAFDGDVKSIIKGFKRKFLNK